MESAAENDFERKQRLPGNVPTRPCRYAKARAITGSGGCLPSSIGRMALCHGGETTLNHWWQF
jgi:hypothetical protein